MTQEELASAIFKLSDNYEGESPYLDWTIKYNTREEAELESIDYKVNLKFAATLPLPVDEMARGIFRCVLAHNGEDWLVGW